MKENETYREGLQRILSPEDFESIAIAMNALRPDRLDQIHGKSSGSEILGGAIIWGETNEGHNYWATIYNRLTVEEDTGLYIVLETHGGPEYAAIVTDEDGNNKVFTSYKGALKEAENCQDGVIVKL